MLIVEIQDFATGSTKTSEYNKNVISLGKAEDNDIVLARSNISRRHATLTNKNGVVIVEDKNSTNGTYVNGVRIPGPQKLAKKDEIRLGDFVIRAYAKTQVLEDSTVITHEDEVAGTKKPTPARIDADRGEEDARRPAATEARRTSSATSTGAPAAKRASVPTPAPQLKKPASVPPKPAPPPPAEPADEVLEEEEEQQPVAKAPPPVRTAPRVPSRPSPPPTEDDIPAAEAPAAEEAEQEEEEREKAPARPPARPATGPKAPAAWRAELEEEAPFSDTEVGEEVPDALPAATAADAADEAERAAASEARTRGPEDEEAPPARLEREKTPTESLSAEEVDRAIALHAERIEEAVEAEPVAPPPAQEPPPPVHEEKPEPPPEPPKPPPKAEPEPKKESKKGEDEPAFDRNEMFMQTVENFLADAAPLLKDPSVSELMINGPKQIYVERSGKVELTTTTFRNDDQVLSLVRNIAQFVGRRISEENPYMDARLPDGSRVAIMIPPCCRIGPSLSIRKFSKKRLGIDDLIKFGSLNPDAARFLDIVVKLHKNLLVSGGTGSGKTSLLNIVSGLIPADERIIVIEDSSELQLQQEHVVPFETKPPDREGHGEVSIRDLVKASLRFRPDRIIVGECRGGEALDLLQAMNTGHSGSMATIHASSPIQTLSRLETLSLFAGLDIPIIAMRSQVANAIEIIVQTARLRDGSRKVINLSEVLELSESGNYRVQDIFRFEQVGIDSKGKIVGLLRQTGKLPTFYDQMKAFGIDVPPEFFTHPPPLPQMPPATPPPAPPGGTKVKR